MDGDRPFKDRSPLYEGAHQGIQWCIYQSPLSSVLNGYARIPDGVEIDVDTLDVHGGITYGFGICSGGWIGFDTAHTGDHWDVEYLRSRVGVHVSPAGIAYQERGRSMWSGNDWERVWTVEKLRAECERLCEQIATVATRSVGVPREGNQ